MKKYLSENSKLVSEFHATKNEDLQPEDFTVGSSKKVWWQCPKEDDHEWESRVSHRSNGTGCPFCNGKQVSKSNNLLAKHPEVASEWHPTKNGDLKPEDFTVGSSKKVWWQCSKVDDHEWETWINHRSNGGGCPFCSGQRVSKSNNLLVRNPKLASEWHPTKNGDLKPEDFIVGSNTKVWWQCPKDDDHEWHTSIRNRRRGDSCSVCSGRKVSKSNNLLARNPKLASEWHPTKNGDSKPEDFTVGSSKKVWWQCPKEDAHQWDTSIAHRSNGSGCPFCKGIGTSAPEIRVLCELRHLLGSKEVAWRNKINGVEIDIFLSKYNIGIEYDGSYWHREKLQSDIKKNAFFQKKSIQILRVREHPLKVISQNDIVIPEGNLTKNDLNDLIFKIKSVLNLSEDINFDSYIANPSFLNELEFKRFVSFLPSPPPEYSIINTHPEISKQWHYEKNSPLKPENFTSGSSSKKVWWKCTKGVDHQWEATIYTRSSGSGCPFCSGNRVSKTNNLLAKQPKIASEWHPIKNGDLRPEDFTSGSNRKFWWQCPKGDDHEYEAQVYLRTNGNGCPFCSGKKPSKANNLLVKNPTLASEWHPIKNGDLRPEDFTPMSSKKIWWKCPKGDDHEWEISIAHRSNGTRCPFCSGRKSSKRYNLLVINPILASEWHQIKNGDLSKYKMKVLYEKAGFNSHQTFNRSFRKKHGITALEYWKNIEDDH